MSASPARERRTASRAMAASGAHHARDRPPARATPLCRVTARSVIGRSIPRLDGREKAAGLTRYAGDLRLPGMLHARLVLSPPAPAPPLPRPHPAAPLVTARTSRASRAPRGAVEPRAAVASVDPLGGLAVWTSTQALFHTRSQVAEALGLPEHRVRVTATPIGGGFGAKFTLLEPLPPPPPPPPRRPGAGVLPG